MERHLVRVLVPMASIARTQASHIVVLYMSYLFQDWNANKGNLKGRIVMLLFRLAHPASKNRVLRIVWIPYIVFYRLVVEWVLCIELPYRTKVGKNFFLAHGQALVVNWQSVIGENCSFRHSTTVGSKQRDDGSYSGSPVIGNNVDLGSNVCIIGEVRIGDYVRVGAGSVVVKDIPDRSVAVGNPARVIRTIATA